MSSGGAERVIHNLITEWCTSQELDISLILMYNKQPIFYQLPSRCHLTIISSRKKSALFEKIDRYRKLRKIIIETKPDVVLSMPEEIGIYVLVALLGTKIPVVVSERNNPWIMPNKKITRFLRKLMYPHAAGLIFQTKQASSFFSKKLQAKGIVLPNPLDTEALPEPYTGEREKVIMGAGRLDKQKNFPLLIDAFAEFYQTHPDYKLIIYGEGGLRSELEQYILEKELPAGTITLPGRTTKLIEELRTKAMFVLSSDYEGMPNVVIEAMAVGTPVISTDCPSGGSAELIENGVSGLLVPAKDQKALTNAMCQIADQKELGVKLSQNSPFIKNKLNSETVSKQWRVYLENVSRKK